MIRTGKPGCELRGARCSDLKYKIFSTFGKIKTVRKALKIKALMLFAAWIMIFAHNIIPHNHPSENISGCHELVHKTNPDENDSNGLHKYKSQPEDIKVCHISSFLFQQFSQDNFYFGYDRDFSLDPSVIAEDYLFTYEQEFFSDPSVGSTTLRAPPVA
jgi:hypothetical protein